MSRKEWEGKSGPQETPRDLAPLNPAKPSQALTAERYYLDQLGHLTGATVAVFGGRGETGVITDIAHSFHGSTLGAVVRWENGRESFWYLRDLKVIKGSDLP